MKTTLFVLGGWLIEKSGVWQTTPVGEMADHIYPTNDRLRVDAAFCYWKNNPATVIITSGGSGGKLLPGSPTVASVMKQELIALGIPEGAILLEEESRNTFEELQALPAFFNEHGKENIIIVSNEWHLPRVKALIQHAPLDLKEKLSSVQFLSAEEILLKEGDKWKKVVEDSRNVSGLSDRIALEKKGIKALANGTYFNS